MHFIEINYMSFMRVWMGGGGWGGVRSGSYFSLKI